VKIEKDGDPCARRSQKRRGSKGDRGRIETQKTEYTQNWVWSMKDVGDFQANVDKKWTVFVKRTPSEGCGGAGGGNNRLVIRFRGNLGMLERSGRYNMETMCSHASLESDHLRQS